MNIREFRDQRSTLLDVAQEMVEKAEREKRELSPLEDGRYKTIMSQVDNLGKEIERLESLPRRMNNTTIGRHTRIMADSEARALAAYIRGDRSALMDLESGGDEYDAMINLPEIRAVNSTMNITTEADGKYAIPTGFAGVVAARRNEIRLSDRLGIRRVPGKGTTVQFPYENANPNLFATTAEQDDAHSQNYERDAAVLGSKEFTLVKKTKKLELTEELLTDEDAALMDFIADHIGRAMALTHNAMLLAEVAANGTALKTFASAGAISAGEIDDLVFHDTLGYYLDDGGSCGWVMRPGTHGTITEITGNARTYANFPAGNRRELLNYPVYYSNSAAAIAAEAKSVYFGNWWYVGMREDPALRIIRDPYSVDGLVILKYSFRTCYGVLVAGGIGYGVHPAAGS